MSLSSLASLPSSLLSSPLWIHAYCTSSLSDCLVSAVCAALAPLLVLSWWQNIMLSIILSTHIFQDLWLNTVIHTHTHTHTQILPPVTLVSFILDTDLNCVTNCLLMLPLCSLATYSNSQWYLIPIMLCLPLYNDHLNLETHSRVKTTVIKCCDISWRWYHHINRGLKRFKTRYPEGRYCDDRPALLSF